MQHTIKAVVLTSPGGFGCFVRIFPLIYIQLLGRELILKNIFGHNPQVRVKHGRKRENMAAGEI